MGSVFRFKGRKTYWISYYVHGRRYRESSGSDKITHAKRLLAQRIGQADIGKIVNPKIHRVTFGDLAKDVLNDYRIRGRASYAHAERRLKLHLYPFFEHRRASQITATEIREFISKRQRDGASNAEINRELALITRAYSLGAKSGKALQAPAIEMLDENNVRSGFFEWAEFQTLLKHLPDEIQMIARFGYITGWRKNEILQLQWNQVDFPGRQIRLNPGTTKNKEGRVFPFTADLEDLLKVQKETTRALEQNKGIICRYVFHRHGQRILDFRKAWDNACKDAKLAGRIFHDFRRTAVRNLIRAGIPERVAMTMTGHKTRSVFERYNIVSETDLKEAAEKLNIFKREVIK